MDMIHIVFQTDTGTNVYRETFTTLELAIDSIKLSYSRRPGVKFRMFVNTGWKVDVTVFDDNNLKIAEFSIAAIMPKDFVEHL